jgi:hypothetical protein
MQITESDMEREERIRTLTDQVVYASSSEIRRERMRMLESEIAKRSPDAVLYLEKQKRLQ